MVIEKDVTVRVRMAEGLKTDAGRAARTSGLTLLDWIRGVVARAANEGTFAPRAVDVERGQAGPFTAQVRMTEDLKGFAEEAARRSDLTLSEWIRAVVARAANEGAFAPRAGGKKHGKKARQPREG